MLCASAFTAIDTYRIHAFRGKCFRWGHFVDIDKTVTYESINKKKESGLRCKQGVSILWAGRLIGLKNPEFALRVAVTLRNKGIPFHLTIIGTGPLKNQMKKIIKDNDLEGFVKMLDSMTSTEVRSHMEKSDIFLFTSGRMEGWGASLNESMASGCAVIADSAIGAAPYLVEHMKNGLLYQTGNYRSFEDMVMELATDKGLRDRLGREAFVSMRKYWTPQIAAERLCILIDALLNNKTLPVYDIGPISKAPLIRRNWFK